MSTSGSSRVPAPSLAGTGRLADDLYLMAHHERTGRPLLASRAAGLGLAGGLLGELILADAIGIYRGEVIIGPTPPDDVLAATILSQVAGEATPRPVADWLAVLSRTAHGAVAGRLEQAGYLVAVEARPWRPSRWVPSDPDCAFAPVARLKAAVDVARPARRRPDGGAGRAGRSVRTGRPPGRLPAGPVAHPHGASSRAAGCGLAGGDHLHPSHGRRRAAGPPPLTHPAPSARADNPTR